MTDNSTIIDGSMLLEYLEKRASELGLKSSKTADPDAFRISAAAGCAEVMTLKKLVMDLMKASQSP